VLGPGFRLGWATGPKLLIDKIALACQACSVGACSLSQVGAALPTWGLCPMPAEHMCAHVVLLRLALAYGTCGAGVVCGCQMSAQSEKLVGLVTWMHGRCVWPTCWRRGAM
jgi:hypothetical protein